MNKDAVVLKRMLGLARPFWGWMTLAGLIGFLTVGSSIGLMATGAWLISAAALHPSIAGLQVAIVGVRFFGIARGVFRYLERIVSHSATFSLLKRLRVWFYERVEPLAPARLVAQHSGDLLSRVVSDVEALENLYMRMIGPALVALFTAVLMGVFLASYDPALALAALVFFALGGVALPLGIGALAKRAGQGVISARAALHTTLIGGLQGMADLLAFNATGREADRVRDQSAALGQHRQALARVEALNNSLMMLAAGGAMLAVLAVAVPRVEGIHLAAIGLGVIASFEAIAPLPLAAQQLGGVVEASRRLFEIADAEPAVVDPLHGPPAPPCFDLEVEGLSFRYSDDEPWVFENLSFRLPEGGRLALVGPSGAGKSTLVSLLLRFWDYEVGAIRLGGHDLNSYRQDDVRGWISVVSQRTHLFNTTIRENLLIARPDASEDELIAAAEGAHIAEFIRGLPQGFDTWVGEGGAKLSGGERQRVAVSRALLKNAPILLLDEATANLDAITEGRVMESIEAAMRGRSTLIISHRPTDLRDVEIVRLGCV